MAAGEGDRQRPRTGVRAVILGLALGMLLHAMTATIVATALPAIVSDLGGMSDLSWVVTAYLFASTVAVPLLGKASDLVGRRPLFLAAIVVFVAGSLICAAAGSMGQLIAGRVVQGAAGGGLMALAMATVGDVVSPRERGRHLGYIGAVFAVATLAGPLVGGAFVDYLSWRWVFYLNVPLGLAAFVVAHRALRIPHRRRRPRIDYAGATLLTTGVLALLLVSEWGGRELAWTSPGMLALLAIATVCLLALIPVERRAAEPIIPLELFRGPVLGVAVALSFVLGAALYGTIVFLPTFLQAVVGTSATASGAALAPLMATALVAMVVSGRLISRWGRYKPFPIVGTAAATAGFVMLASAGPGVGVAPVAGATALVGLGLGLTMHVVVMAVQNAVDPAHLGTATAAPQFLRTLGGTVGLAGFGAVMSRRLTAWAAVHLPADALPAGVDLDEIAGDPAAIAALPADVEALVRTGVADALTAVFLLAVPLMALAVAGALLLRELPLRERATTAVAGPPPATGAASAPPGGSPPYPTDAEQERPR